ncbi:Protein disulfide-isomerase erp38 [Candida viswanathii]|uniref:Protein disulfide-isomerase erp38 n=1 Tax=Candida viswanathii TaxID=5486 RepID=A0A367Y076_9ASCO|nr:Protein disulfide-isomerase erp38 [Candida viswanathii]
MKLDATSTSSTPSPWLLWFVVVSLLRFAASTASSAVSGSIIEFDDNLIQATLEQSEHSFIYFYSDSCKYCRKFDPTFENLSVLYNNNKNRSKFQILKTNARSNQRLSELFKVTKYPTLKLLDYKTKRIIDYEENRDLQSLIGYLDRALNIHPDFENFHSKVEYTKALGDDASERLVFFMAGYLPGWEDYKYPAHYTHQLALDYGDIKVVVVNVEELNDYEVLSKYGVSRFPTVVYMKDGKLKSYTSSENEMKVAKIREFIENVDSDSTGPWKEIQSMGTNSQDNGNDDDNDGNDDNDDDEVFEHIEL